MSVLLVQVETIWGSFRAYFGVSEAVPCYRLWVGVVGLWSRMGSSGGRFLVTEFLETHCLLGWWWVDRVSFSKRKVRTLFWCGCEQKRKQAAAKWIFGGLGATQDRDSLAVGLV